MTELSDMIGKELKKRGFRNLKTAAEFIGISPELLRITIHKEHVPKDNILIKIAKKLGLDEGALILAAHQQKVPADVKTFFLSPEEPKTWGRKRKFPLSEEQCNYLAKLMSVEEIQMVRQLRQVDEEAKQQIRDYIDHLYVTKRRG